MNETSDQSNSHQGAPRKQKNTIKNTIKNFFKPGIETQLRIKNMILSDIPTQTTPVFIHIRQGRERLDTQAVKITENTAIWPDEIEIDCRVPLVESQAPRQAEPAPIQSNSNPAPRPSLLSNMHDGVDYDNYDNYDEENDAPTASSESNVTSDTNSTAAVSAPSSKTQERRERRKEKKERKELERKERKEKREKEKREKKETKEKEKIERNVNFFCLEFTFRLEDVSGRSSTVYGKSVLDLTQITSANDWEYRAVLHECNYESRFSCLISVGTMKKTLSNLSYSSNSSLSSNLNNQIQANSRNSRNRQFNRDSIDMDRSLSESNLKNRLSLHESTSLDGINNIFSKNKSIIVDQQDFDTNDNYDEFASDAPTTTSHHHRSKRNNSLKSSNDRKIPNPPRPHNHQRSHTHRKNEALIQKTNSTLCIPLDQNPEISLAGSVEDFAEKLPFKVQKDRLERLSDQVDDIIQRVFNNSEDDY